MLVIPVAAFQRFRLTLFEIQIGPYATKTGAKPNTIIKRLAGIKARNGLNISTTLGDYKRPSAPDDSNIKAEPKQKRVRKEQHEIHGPHGRAPVKKEGRAGCEIGGGSGPEFGIVNALPTPTASPSSIVSSPSLYPQSHLQPYQHPQAYPGYVGRASSFPKRTFQQTVELGLEDSDLDGAAWKRVKVE